MNVHFLRQVCLQKHGHGDADTYHMYSLVVTIATVLKPKAWLWCLKDFAWEQALLSVVFHPKYAESYTNPLFFSDL